MQDVQQPLRLSQLLWFFNTPYHCYLNGQKVVRVKEYQKKHASLKITFADGQEADLSERLFLESAVPAQNTIRLKDHTGQKILLRYYNTQMERVILEKVFAFMRQYMPLSRHNARSVAMARALCDQVGLKEAAAQWSITPAYARMLVGSMGNDFKYSAKRHPELTPFKGESLTPSRLMNEPEYWLSMITQYAPHLRNHER